MGAAQSSQVQQGGERHQAGPGAVAQAQLGPCRRHFLVRQGAARAGQAAADLAVHQHPGL